MNDEQQREQHEQLVFAQKLFHSALSARSDRDPGQRTAGSLLLIAARKLAETGQAGAPIVTEATLNTMDPDQRVVWLSVAAAINNLAFSLSEDKPDGESAKH